MARLFFPVLLGFLLGLAPLAGQSLQDESLGYLLGAAVYPQDRVLGPLYVPQGFSRARQQIFTLVRSFWNRVNAGELEPQLLSLNAHKQVREQVAPFLGATPPLYREAVQDTQNLQELAGSGAATPPPLNQLRLTLVRLGEPIIDNDYARARCRLGVQDAVTFIPVDMYFLRQDNVWKIDALAVDWDSAAPVAKKAINVFGRKREF